MNKYTIITLFLFVFPTTSSAIQPLFSGYPANHPYFAINIGFMMPEEAAAEYLDNYYGYQTPRPQMEELSCDEEENNALDWPSEEECGDEEVPSSPEIDESARPNENHNNNNNNVEAEEPVNAEDAAAKRKTNICKHWRNGHCPRGAENCNFAHGASDYAESKPECRYFERRGACIYRENCRFRHPKKK